MEALFDFGVFGFGWCDMDGLGGVIWMVWVV